MPFAFCLDCGDQALVDPSGRCPEGHAVGSAGTRVSAAIGSAAPHPDEPVPWTRTVELAAHQIDLQPRVARPPSVATGDGPASGNGHLAPDSETEDLFRELHALGDGDVTSGEPFTAPVPPRAQAAAPSHPPAAATPPPAAAAPSPVPNGSPQDATDLDDLASLMAAVRDLDDRETTGTPPAPPAAASPAAPEATPSAPASAPRSAPEPSEFSELDALFASDVRRDALADVAALDRAAAAQGQAPPSPPAPAAGPPPPSATAAPTPAPPTPPAPPAPGAPAQTAEIGDLEFVAKGSRPRRRSTPTAAKTQARRGMFRR